MKEKRNKQKNLLPLLIDILLPNCFRVICKKKSLQNNVKRETNNFKQLDLLVDHVVVVVVVVVF